MKKILIGLLVLGSISSYASGNCDLTIQKGSFDGFMSKRAQGKAIQILKNKGYTDIKLANFASYPSDGSLFLAGAGKTWEPGCAIALSDRGYALQRIHFRCGVGSFQVLRAIKKLESCDK
jgi:hypothetical protein